ncbi:MAG: adenine phosphoribosyltransferase [Planctomycetes bacterium]|nr:adenine phosphoribosyltransferase [Planctomycetota bacterium]
MAALSDLIREVPDFPKEGILFYDITTLLQDPEGLKQSVAQLVDHYKNCGADVVCSIESRGFIFGVPVALEIGAGFVPIRKPGKLPYKTKSATYDLEYGTDTVEMHIDAVKPGQKVLMIDDLLATGGTMKACCDLVESLGGEIIGAGFVIELDFLSGREKLSKYNVHSLVHYDKG